VLNGRRVLRIVVMNPRTTQHDIEGVMKEVERAAQQVSGSFLGKAVSAKFGLFELCGSSFGKRVART